MEHISNSQIEGFSSLLKTMNIIMKLYYEVCINEIKSIYDNKIYQIKTLLYNTFVILCV